MLHACSQDENKNDYNTCDVIKQNKPELVSIIRNILPPSSDILAGFAQLHSTIIQHDEMYKCMNLQNQNGLIVNTFNIAALSEVVQIMFTLRQHKITQLQLNKCEERPSYKTTKQNNHTFICYYCNIF